MRKFKRLPNEGRTAITKVLPAPVGGLNKRDALSAMPPEDAYVLDNWFPRTDGLETRGPFEEHATGLGGPVKTLAVYTGGDPALLGFADGSVFDCTAAGAVGAALETGRANDAVITAMFSNTFDQFLIGVNGVDSPFGYDGTVFADLVITGIADPDTLSYVHAFKGRLYFAATDICGFYYLPVGQIQGAVSAFDLGEVSQTGGALVSIATITRDGGSGPDDFICFILNTGEVIVYQGYDPDDVTLWQKVGSYITGRPIGNNCVVKFGGDIILISEMGLIPLEKVFSGEAEYSESQSPISSKLGDALRSYLPYADTHGWQAQLHGAGDMLLFNVPADTSTQLYHQFVMNTITRAWCRFRGLDGLCWEVINRELYFGGYDGSIYKYLDTGIESSDEVIQADAKQAFSYFGESRLKHFHSSRLQLQFSGQPPMIVGFNVDYKDNSELFTSTLSGPDDEGSWDTSTWDDTSWALDLETQTFWQEINRMGFSGSHWLRTSITGARLRWFATETIYSLGGNV